MKNQEYIDRLASITSGQLSELLSLIPATRQTKTLRNALRDAEVMLDSSFGIRTVEVPLSWNEVTS